MLAPLACCTDLAQSSVHGIQVWLDEDGTEAVPHKRLSHEHGQLVLFLSQQLQTQVGRLPYPAQREQPGLGVCAQL